MCLVDGHKFQSPVFRHSPTQAKCVARASLDYAGDAPSRGRLQHIVRRRDVDVVNDARVQSDRTANTADVHDAVQTRC